MVEKKTKMPMGYSTPAAQLQNRFEELLESVGQKTKTWLEFDNKLGGLMERLGKDMATAKSQQVQFAQINLLGQIITLLFICRLGEDLAETEAKIVKLEKSIELLNTKLK